MALRISCATPVLGPVAGVAGVGLASALAGAAARAAREAELGGGGGGGGASGRWQVPFSRGRLDSRSSSSLAFSGHPSPPSSPSSPSFAGWRRASAWEAAVVDAAVGIALFKVMGGRFRSVMPSDLARPGANARVSLPAAGKEYAGASARRDLGILLRRHGCHHCGSRHGPVVADHMPPNKAIARKLAGGAARLSGVVQRVRPLRAAASALGIPVGPPRQRFFPQCIACCQRQAAAIRNNRRTLVAHLPLMGGATRAWHWAGVLVGLRHYGTSLAGGAGRMGGRAGGGARGWRR